MKIHFTWRQYCGQGIPLNTGSFKRDEECREALSLWEGEWAWEDTTQYEGTSSPSTATGWSWKCYFFMKTVTAEHSSSSRWVEVEAAALPWAPSLPSTRSHGNSGAQGWASLEPESSRGSCWEENSAVAKTELQELNTVIYKTHSAQDQAQYGALQLLVLAYIDASERWSSVWILPIWNLWYRRSNLRSSNKCH